ncbi:hypothetical protein JOQ06_009689, partial [Pogonophryne albipinna]
TVYKDKQAAGGLLRAARCVSADAEKKSFSVMTALEETLPAGRRVIETHLKVWALRSLASEIGHNKSKTRGGDMGCYLKLFGL